MTVRALRGAITAYDNEQDEIYSSTEILLNRMIASNNLGKDDIISIVFTASPDLDAAFPAAAARRIGLDDVPLMCACEIDVPGAIPLCIRVLLHFNTDRQNSQLRHIYMRKAWKLRPDLSCISIAIDGPSGAGKSTIARKVAERLGIVYLDTGAMYRAFALKSLEKGVDPKDRVSLTELLSSTGINVSLVDGDQKVYLDDRDVTGEIRSPEVTKASSDVSAIPEVRARMVELQRSIAADRSIVMDGRDIGTHVLLYADFKFFLTASPVARVQRRYNEMTANGIRISVEDVRKDLSYRDENDSGRECCPLTKAPDAVEIDTTLMTIGEVTDEVINIITR